MVVRIRREGRTTENENENVVRARPTRGLLYALDGGSQQLLSYSLDPTTGALALLASSPVLSPNTNGFVPYSYGSLALTPSGPFLIVQDNAAEVVKSYVPAANGAMTLASTFSPGAGNTVSGVTLDSTGLLVYVTTGSGPVFQLALDPGTGALTAVGSPVTAGFFPTSVGLDPVASFAYVLEPNQILGYTRDASGALSASGHNVSMSAYTGSITVDPAGRFAYLVAMANNASGTAIVGQVRTYSIDAGTGALTYVTGPAFSPASLPGQVKAFALDASGSFAFGVTQGPDAVAVYSIDGATGLCWPLSTTGCPTPIAGPSSVIAVK